jgi:uncharacterized protein (DUF2342 family)
MVSRVQQRGSLKEQLAESAKFSAKQTKELAVAWDLVASKARELVRLRARLDETFGDDVQQLVKEGLVWLDAIEQDVSAGALKPHTPLSPGANLFERLRKIREALRSAET